MTKDLVGKYDRIADGFSETSYANLAFYMERRFLVATGWGIPLLCGDSVLELGCGDGYLARLFVQEGLHYFGVDLSQRMVAAAQQRLLMAGLKADFSVSDIAQMEVSEPCDAVICYMRAFFTYVSDPSAVLQRLRPYVRKKIIVDLDPRRNVSVNAAVEVLRKAGFERVCWRPFFVPEKKPLSATILKTLVACENVPLLRAAPLRWKFHVLLKGEVC
jgi:SAM-dependent methyltransferase